MYRKGITHPKYWEIESKQYRAALEERLCQRTRAAHGEGDPTFWRTLAMSYRGGWDLVDLTNNILFLQLLNFSKGASDSG